MYAAQHGDRRAFDALAATYVPLLHGFLLHRVGAGAVDDVLQETLLAGWMALPGYSRRASFKAWLFAIAVRKCVDFYRMRGRRGLEVPLEEAEGHLNAQKDWCAATDWKQAIRSVLALLSPEQEEVVAMYYYAELSLPEIANALERNLNTVKYQFYRAHTLVEKALAEETITEETITKTDINQAEIGKDFKSNIKRKVTSNR